MRTIVPYRRLSLEDPTRLVYGGEGDARDPRPHEMLDLRAAETSLMQERFVMLPHVSALDLAKLHQKPELYDDREHVREVTASRAAYRFETEALTQSVRERNRARCVRHGGERPRPARVEGHQGSARRAAEARRTGVDDAADTVSRAQRPRIRARDGEQFGRAAAAGYTGIPEKARRGEC